MASIDINRERVRRLAGTCADGGEALRKGTPQLDDGYVPSTELACKSTWLTCKGAWSAVFARMARHTESVGGKLRAVTGMVGATDQAIEDEFEVVQPTEPASVPGTSGGRHYR